MKEKIHPNYRPVIFEDASAGFRFLTRSTMSSAKKVKWEDGNEYPLISIDVSSESHPFYTGKHKILDTGGRVEKFRKKYAGK